MYRDLEKSAEIKQDDHILGQFSKQFRQIDVSIRYKFASTDHLIIVEAKDHKHPADVKVIDAFISKIKDVRADRGIIISAKGFSKKAITYARESRIDALTVHSALNKRWETAIQIPAIRHEYHFDLLENRIMYEIAQFAGQKVTFNEELFSYDGGSTKLDFISLIDLHCQLSKKNKKLLSRSEITINLKGAGLVGLFNNTWVPIEEGTIRFKFNSLRKYYRYFTPEEYLIVKNHITERSEIRSTVAEFGRKIVAEQWYNTPR